MKKMKSADLKTLFNYLYTKDKSPTPPPIPAISITPSRRVSVSSPIRFTRTFSQDSLNSIEKNGRKELRRQKMMETQDSNESSMSLSPSATATCPHLGEMGRSRTEPSESGTEHVKLTLPLKRSTGDLSRDAPSPTRKRLTDFIGLTNYQQKLLVQSWPNIYSTGTNGQFASSIYTHLSNKNAKARQLLAKANGVAVFAQSEDCTAMHARATLELIDTAVHHLDNNHTRLTAYIIEVGKAHRHLRAEGLGTGVWDELGDSIIECLRRFESLRKHKELRRAWLALIAYIIDNLKQGQSFQRSPSSYDGCDWNTSPSKKKNSQSSNA